VGLFIVYNSLHVDFIFPNVNITLPLKTQFSQQVWIQAIGRGLYQLGSAVLIFYTPIVFVNYGNMSATEVGFAIGGGSVAGFVGNIIGGILTDSPKFGRKRTLSLSALFAIITSTVMIFTHDFTFLLLANIFFGLSTGLYWTSADAAVMDVTASEVRQEAFSLLGLTDNLGFGLGTLAGGFLIKILHPKEFIFAASTITFLFLLLLFMTGLVETRKADGESHEIQKGWKTALTDTRLMIYLLVNTLFITYIALVGSTLPLYLVNFGGTSESTVANLFTWGYVGLGALFQVPVIKVIAKFNYLTSLMLSMGVWGLGFLLVWVMSSFFDIAATYEFGILSIFAIASVIYKPTSSAWISELAPSNLRGAYTAIAYQCWTIGYIIGPIVGGWAMDQSQNIAQNTWLAVAASTFIGLTVLFLLNQKSLGISTHQD
jgi:MFS family permease